MVGRVLCPVLVRRDEELSVLEDALLACHRGESRFVILAGEAGIGKTRLVTELAREARKLGFAVLWGSCSEAELALPYLPFVEAIGNHLAAQDVEALGKQLGPARRELAQLFPQLSDGAAPEPGPDPAQAKLRLFEAIVSLLAVAARDRPLALVVEDVHWAEDSSRELLDHLARRLAALTTLVVVTYRSDELHRRHPLLPTVQGWRRSGLAETVELDPLPPAGVAEMIGAIFDTEVGEDFRNLMHERSEGNPFVLEEMLKEATDRGDIFLTDAGWDRKSLEELRIPETVRDSILLRLARLEPGHVDALQTAAVLGRTFGYPTLLEVSGAAEAEVQSALQAAVAQQLIDEQPEAPGHYRWRHALTQEAIYTDAVTPRRQQIHSRAADALGKQVSTRPVDVAYHLLGAGRFAEAVPVCIRGAEDAERAAAFSETISLLERALPHVMEPVERARIVCRIGRAHWLNGASPTAERFLQEGIADLEGLGEPVEAARFRVILGRCLWEGLRPDLALREFELARDVLSTAGPSADLALAYMRIAGLRAFELDYEGCLEAAQEAVGIAEAAGADFERVWALAFLALGFLSCDVDRAFDVMDTCFREAEAKGYRLVASNVSYNDIWERIHTMQPDLETRLERLEGLTSVAPALGALSLASSYVRRVRGDLRAAKDEAESGLALYQGLRSAKMAWRCKVQLAEVLLEMARIEEAVAVLPPASTRTELQDIVYDAAARIRCSLARGEIEEAVSFAQEIGDHADTLALYRGALALGAEAFVAAGKLDEAQALIDRGRAYPTKVGTAFLDEAQGRILLGRGSAPDALPFLRNAVQEAERVGFRLAAMRSRVLLAEALGGSGALQEAERELPSVAEEADRCGAGLIRVAANSAAEALGVALPASPAVVETAGETEPIALGERLVTSLFADVRGYSELTASAVPAELQERMGTLYRFAKTEVVRHHGIVDKFAGDAVMATFNVSGTRIDHCVHALEAALGLRDKAALLDLQLGIGIAVGPAVVGKGASGANISVQGVATNLASRLQAAANGGQILLSEDAHRRVERWLLERGIEAQREELMLKGFAARQVVYRVFAPAFQDQAREAL